VSEANLRACELRVEMNRSGREGMEKGSQCGSSG
jgi:hypothetical protein